MTKIAVEYQHYQRSQLMKELAAAAHGDQYVGQTSSAVYPEIRERVKMMSLPQGSRILDAGCGNGAFSIPLASEFPFFVDGVDLGEELTIEATRIASKAMLSSKCRFFTQDFAKFSLPPSDIYDAVICVGSLYWGQPLSSILDVWHRITRPGGELLLFLNLAYTPLNQEEKEALGETQFFSPLTVKEELAKNGWELSEWSDGTDTYIQWLKRWCQKMEDLSSNLVHEMGEDKASRLIGRFTTYLKLAEKRAVCRIIVRAKAC